MTATATYTRKTNVQTYANEFMRFEDIRDARGRVLGLYVNVHGAEHVAVADYGCWDAPAGTWYYVRVQQTRNGRDFGAHQYPTRFATLEEAWAHAYKTIGRRRKAYLKQFAA
jgi:hypothetical protein